MYKEGSSKVGPYIASSASNFRTASWCFRSSSILACLSVTNRRLGSRISAGDGMRLRNCEGSISGSVCEMISSKKTGVEIGGGGNTAQGSWSGPWGELARGWCEYDCDSNSETSTEANRSLVCSHDGVNVRGSTSVAAESWLVMMKVQLCWKTNICLCRSALAIQPTKYHCQRMDPTISIRPSV